MKSSTSILLTLALGLLLTTSLFGAVSAQADSASAYSAVGSEHVTAKLLANVNAVRPGAAFKLGVELVMAPGWHTYYKESGDAGMPTRIEWILPPGFKAGPLEWEKPERFDEAGIITFGYKDKTLIATTVVAPADIPAGIMLDFQAKVKWLECKEVCIPGQAGVSLALPVASGGERTAANVEKFSAVGYKGPLPGTPAAGSAPGLIRGEAGEAKARSILDQELKVAGATDQKLDLPAYFLFAFIGGFILNFMPCVLPVISIKLLGFVQQAQEEPGRIFRLGLAFTAGILASCLVLAVIVIAIKQAGQQIGWGFQFQNPGFVIAMSVLILLLSLSLFGLYYVPIPGGQSQINRLAGQEGYGGSFFAGVLATTLATPCTAPFLGTAVGFAFTQPAWVILAMFLIIGLGMAFPYVLITAKPGWMRFIPKPGNWMNTFKEVMGFVLLATVLWLLWILGDELGLPGVLATVSFLLSVGFAAWVVGHFTDLTSSAKRVYTVWAIALATVGVAYYLLIAPILSQPARASKVAVSASDGESGIVWQPFTLEALDQHLADGKTVFIDFTAEWCLTCKVNERTAINTRAVAAKMAELGVVPLKADWTNQNPIITRLLEKFGRSGVPLYVIFPAGRPTEPIVLPELVTESIVLGKLAEAGPSRDVSSGS